MAAAILIISINSFRKLKEPGANDGGISDIWVEGRLPEDIEMRTRLYLRSLQISLRIQLGKEYMTLAKDLDALLDEAGEKDAWGVFGSCVTVVLGAGMTDASLPLKYIEKALQSAKRLKTSDGKPYEFADTVRISSLLWMCGASCNTEETLKDWFKIIAELSPAERSEFFVGTMAEEGCSTICDGIWLREDTTKETGKRDWGKVLAWLQVIEAQGRNWKAQDLTTAAVRAQIIVNRDYLKNMEEGVRLADVALGNPDASDLTKFLLGQVIGRGFLDTGNNAKALEWLVPVTRLTIGSFPRLRMRAALEAEAAVSCFDPTKALEFANLAVDVTKNHPRLRGLDSIVALAEKTVTLWHCNDRLSSFSCWEEALTRMLECETRRSRQTETRALETFPSYQN